MSKTVLTYWEVWSYDVWGNAEEGYDVNDRRCMERAYPIRLKPVTHNVGTEREFTSASPSDYQLGRIFGTRATLDTEGDDTHIYVNRASDSYPIGELYCFTHESLSPVREVKDMAGEIESQKAIRY